jgi:hypothetical protein
MKLAATASRYGDTNSSYTYEVHIHKKNRFFSRNDVPQDVKDRKPNPSSWPAPAAFFPTKDCDVNKHFYDHALTLNIALCGESLSLCVFLIVIDQM